MRNDRLFQILYLLLEKKTITAKELSEKLEVSTRTIYRDIDSLSACGIPVFAVAGKNGGISLMPGYTFDKTLLSDKEQNEILYALQSLQVTGQNVDLLLAKLGSVFKKTNHNWIEVDFTRWGYKKVDSEKFNLIKQSILDKQILHIDYLNSYGSHTKRNIKSVRLVFKSANWYLQAFCLKAQDFRTFKINRILSLKLSGDFFDDEFDIIPPIDSEDLSNESGFNLTLKIAASSAFRAYDEFELKNITMQTDGSLIVTATMPPGSWIYSYLLSYGTDVQILSPLSLKNELKYYLEKLQNYFKS